MGLALLLSTGALGGERAVDLTDLDLERLMQVRIISASKREQQLLRTPAAAFVISQEDIRRSGARSIPDLLRMVPGIQVARINSSEWAVSARWFNHRFANKLLVLVDGRTVYSPMVGGTFWEAQNVPLADIERIEVIRGPGGTVWGANAVNGVINIITKRAEETQGALLTLGAGSEERAFGGFRYGGKLGEAAFYRLYAEGFARDGQIDRTNDDTADEWGAGRLGFRLDWATTEADSFTVQADFYRTLAHHKLLVPTLAPPFGVVRHAVADFHGGDIVFRWDHRFSEDSVVTVQAYLDKADFHARHVGTSRIHIFDVDAVHTFRASERHRITWGVGYRSTWQAFNGTELVSFDPDRRRDDLFSVFFQDEVTLVRDRLWLTAGTKAEHNDYTGYEFQPSLRLTWAPTERQTLWAAATRAVRVPTPAETDVRILQEAFPLEDGTPALVPFRGSRGQPAEEHIAFELGYRAQLNSRLTLDLTAFHSRYDHLWTSEPDAPFPEGAPVPHVVLPFRSDDQARASTWGFEAAAAWRVLDHWRVQAAYSFLKLRFIPESDSADPASATAERQIPRHIISLRSSHELPGNLELDLWARFVDAQPAFGVPSYLTLDARLCWKPRRDVELFIVGQNLLQRHHREGGSSFIRTEETEVERGVYLGARLRF